MAEVSTEVSGYDLSFVFTSITLLCSHNQLSLLDAHAHCLSQRSVQVEDQLKAPEYRALVLPDHPSNPLLAQMQTSSKFAVMVRINSINHQLVTL